MRKGSEAKPDCVPVYELLGRLFLRPVDEGLYPAVVDIGFWERTLAGDEHELVRRGLCDLRPAIGSLEGLGPRAGRTRLATEFTSWFVGPERQLVPPWESLYQGDEKHLFGPPAMQVREFMRGMGLKNERFGQWPEDHIGFELLVLSALGECGSGDDDTRGAVSGFIAEHPLPLCRRMLAKAHELDDAGSGFYAALLEVVEGVLEEDEEGLASSSRS